MLTLRVLHDILAVRFKTEEDVMDDNTSYFSNLLKNSKLFFTKA